jgi:hypothetical protein
MLQRLTDDLAAAVKRVDALRPVAKNKRSGISFEAGLGPHSEAETIALVFREIVRAHSHVYAELATSVPYPNNPRQRCDVRLVTSEGPLFIEGKLLRLKGDNGKPNDNMLMHILSPYPQHRSALTDCTKLSSSGIADSKAIVLIGYTYDDMPLEPAICAFEKLACSHIGPRSEAAFFGLCHRVHCSGGLFARASYQPCECCASFASARQARSSGDGGGPSQYRPRNHLAVGTAEHFLDLIRFERAAQGLDQGNRQLLADRAEIFTGDQEQCRRIS